MLFQKALRRVAPAAALFLSLSAYPQPGPSVFDGLSGTERNRAVDRFGLAAEAAVELESAFLGRRGAVDRESIDAAIEGLAKVDALRLGAADRRKLGRAWQLAAELTRRLDGPTVEMVLQLELAYSLVPDDPELERQVVFERQRKRAAELRVAEAKRVREARERGEDPFEGFGNPEILDISVQSKGGI